MRGNGATGRPLTVLIAALGGEGGGVLTNWIVNAARRAGLPVQSTSIPGVAQRTGATTYYIEIWPEAAINGARPVMALSPAPGELDIVASTELLEAGRAIAGGFVTPDRTCLIASTHRVLTTREKSAMADGQFDRDRLLAAAADRAAECVLLDLESLARAAAAPLNAVMLGVIAGSGRLPLDPEFFAEGIRREGKAVEANLRGFEAGLAAARPETGADEAPVGSLPRSQGCEMLVTRARTMFPAEVQGVFEHALDRLVDYQDAAYAELYLDRLMPFREMPPELVDTVARQLAVRMTYEDIIRVADLKTKPQRLERIRADLGAAVGEPVRVVDFFKPRLAEVCDILPARPAAWVRQRAGKRPRLARWTRAMKIRTTSISGFLTVWILARLRPLRRRTSRFAAETAALETWLADIEEAAARDLILAQEICDCAGLVKGYGDTHHRGSANYNRIREALILPALDGDGADAAPAIARARTAALADPEGAGLDRELSDAAVEAAGTGGD